MQSDSFNAKLSRLSSSPRFAVALVECLAGLLNQTSAIIWRAGGLL